jgi:formate hydrogenlyase subunit 3/multisubunit Na+/H+ antiporter MnhD subunit
MSTISQLGYMVMAVGISQYNVALMHVVNHAFLLESLMRVISFRKLYYMLETPKDLNTICK